MADMRNLASRVASIVVSFGLGVLAIVALTYVISECSGRSEDATAPETSSAAPVMKVSDATICGQLIDADDPSLFQQSIDLLKGDAQVAGEVPGELEDLAARAESETLATHLQVMADELDAIFAGEKTKTDDFQASALEVNNVCGSTARF